MSVPTDAQMKMLDMLLAMCPDGKKTIGELYAANEVIRMMVTSGDIVDPPTEITSKFFEGTTSVQLMVLHTLTVLPGFDVLMPGVVDNMMHVMAYTASVFYQLGSMDKSSEVRDLLKGLTDGTN